MMAHMEPEGVWSSVVRTIRILNTPAYRSVVKLSEAPVVLMNSV